MHPAPVHRTRFRQILILAAIRRRATAEENRSNFHHALIPADPIHRKECMMLLSSFMILGDCLPPGESRKAVSLPSACGSVVSGSCTTGIYSSRPAPGCV